MIGQTSKRVLKGSGIPSGAVLLICGLMMAGAGTTALAYSHTGSSNAPRHPAGRHIGGLAHAAGRTVPVQDTVITHLVTQQGGTLINEQGTATGTLKCPVTMQLKLGLTEASMSLSCRAKGGTLNGHGESTFYVEGTVTHFTGTLKVTKSTGKYAHATADVHMHGTMQRGSFALAATLAGTLSTK